MSDGEVTGSSGASHALVLQSPAAGRGRDEDRRLRQPILLSLINFWWKDDCYVFLDLDDFSGWISVDYVSPVDGIVTSVFLVGVCVRV